MKENIHVTPLNDLREHFDDMHCWCLPSVLVENGTKIFVHNSADGREILEDLNLKTGELSNHLASVANLWFTTLDKDNHDSIASTQDNDAIALRWLTKRFDYLKPTIGAIESRAIAFANYCGYFV